MQCYNHNRNVINSSVFVNRTVAVVGRFFNKIRISISLFRTHNTAVVPTYTAAVQNCYYFRDLNSELAPEVLPILLLKNEMRKWKYSLTNVGPLPGGGVGEVFSSNVVC